MSSWVEVSKIGDLIDGTKKDILVNGREILLANVGDKYYATDNRCPHMGAKLSSRDNEREVVK